MSTLALMTSPRHGDKRWYGNLRDHDLAAVYGGREQLQSDVLITLNVLAGAREWWLQFLLHVRSASLICRRHGIFGGQR